jgi:hypothetical protein
MAAKILNLEMRRGDTPVLEAELRDENRNLVNDPAAQYKLTARATRSAADPPLFEVGPTTQYAPGIGRCGIPVNATSGFTHDRVLFYDLQVVEAGGNVNTLLTGKITVLMDVAR